MVGTRHLAMGKEYLKIVLGLALMEMLMNLTLVSGL